MSRVFAYCRVSTFDQTNENQREQIASAGYMIEPYRFVQETISGSVPALQRSAFAKMLERMEQNDTLVVSKLDRIGRDAIDVQQTVELFKKRGIRLVVLQLGNIDLTSSAGELTVAILSAMAQFERSILIERVQAGLQRARNEGKRLGRPAKTNTTQRLTIVERRADGVSVSQLARDFSVSRATILSITAA